MDAQTAVEQIEQIGLVAVLRGNFPPDTALAVCDVLMDVGITVFEFTVNSNQAFEAMVATKSRYGANACVGMGTVLDVPMALKTLEAGGDFVVSPAFNPDVVRLAQEADILVIPGVITPTEIVNAWAMGVKILKLFPIGPLGVDYFQIVRGPLNHIKFMCNGGIDAANTSQFLRAGAAACGIGGWMTGDGSIPLEQIRSRAQQMVDAVKDARSGVRTLQA